MPDKGENMDEKMDTAAFLASSIARERKRLGMTQAELAEKLGYSDKSISKWERGEGLPDVLCLKRMAELFAVSVDAMLSPVEEAEKEAACQPEQSTEEAAVSAWAKGRSVNYGAIASIAVIGVWMVAALVFLVGHFCRVDLSLGLIVAIPVTGLLAVIFNSLWGSRRLNFWLCSFFVIALLFLLCWILRAYGVWQLMWLSLPAVAIVWLSCRIHRKKKEPQERKNVPLDNGI